MSEKNAYAKSGVDVEAGYEVVERIKKHVARTERAGVMGALGGFGGMFDLSQTGVKEPVLISGTDGVGTKLKIAIEQAKDHLDGAVLASDAFFPFADNIEEIAAAGIKAIIQPGGSVRDQESIDAANKHGLTMIFTGVRHFRH